MAWNKVTKKLRQHSPNYRRGFYEQRIAYWMWYRARQRAVETNVPFNLELSDIAVPAKCPVLGTKFVVGVGSGPRNNSPTLDRIVNAKGYVRGNVVVVSSKVNRLKNNATLQELRAIVKFYDRR